jgi:hypothetical protein
MKMKSKVLAVCMIAAVGMIFALAGQSSAAIMFDQSVTPDVIFGTGNTNGYFTVDRNNGVELGLRAKIPYVGTLNSNGDGTYSYSLAEANPVWNFDWTVNTDYLGSTGLKITGLTYLLGIDFDPSQGTNFLAFDPINVAAPLFFDHSIGTNATPNGGGTEATNAAEYATLIAGNNVLQQSWSHVFFLPYDPTLTYDPTIDGTYDIFLIAFDSTGGPVASTNIQVIIGEGGAIPEPASIIVWGLLGAGCAGGALARRRRRRAPWSEETRQNIHQIIDRGRTNA